MTGPTRSLRTWSIADAGRRRLNEYEIVTKKFHYHFGRQPAPFDLDPDSPINQWYLRHREGSPVQADSWEEFSDPAQLNYRRYIALQHDREIYAERVVDRFEALDHDAGLDPAWVAVLGRVYLPARFALHVLQITSLYVGQLAPSAAITNASFFQAADELRALQWIAYRAKSLSLSHGPDLADSTVARRVWEQDPAWQPARELLENLLLAYDWAEAFTALDLVVKPAFDALFKQAFAALATANRDELTAQLLHESGVDSGRGQDWTGALARYILAARPGNREHILGWESRWQPRVTRAIDALAGTFGAAPAPADAASVRQTVDQATTQFRNSWLTAVPAT
ncbi:MULTISPECIES: aromatic/alkene monooxygenase hydroxylase subunit beta [Protofrankia]|uniref:propane 2-monooxygenase n=1 Tax=Protofrankia coriariae TaxID=1562887 RepID=A0ABR5F774_9ACTN|nr:MULTISPECIES: aromatic/alkene monooxygenase hydroxylase subunit beta [Protofrankia]KLL12579.1 toluene hydroxylase [Protofrankia coriariae]ONH36689.1 toluene hydroxylase [Protofrankia sp. BMG5.30]